MVQPGPRLHAVTQGPRLLKPPQFYACACQNTGLCVPHGEDEGKGTAFTLSTEQNYHFLSLARIYCLDPLLARWMKYMWELVNPTMCSQKGSESLRYLQHITNKLLYFYPMSGGSLLVGFWVSGPK